MEINALNIYLFGLILDSRQTLFWLFTLSTFITVLIGGAYLIKKEEEKCSRGKIKIDCTKEILWFKRGVITTIIMLICFVLAPSKEIATAMFIVPPVVNNEKVQELPDNVLNFVNSWLKKNTHLKDF